MIWQPIRHHAAASMLLLLTVAAPARAAGPVAEESSPDIQRRFEEELGRQRERIAQLEKLVQQQGVLLDSLRARLGDVPPQPGVNAAAPSDRGPLAEVASMEPMLPRTAAAASPAALPKAQKGDVSEPSPLTFRIGTASITPVGFVDLTGIWRSTVAGTGIATSFGSIPYANTSQGRLTEFRLSGQSSRFGTRVDADAKGARVTAYWESDFNGFVPGNAAVSTNSDTFRLRLYWVDVRKGRWELLGGQSWSMITPGRRGISPLPGDLFYTQVIDVNYQAGLTFSRDPQFRVVYHPRDTVAIGVSLESAEQYIGGSAGGGMVNLPSAFAVPYKSQLNDGTSALSVPNLHPDIVGKIAFDPRLAGGRGLHFELGGTVRTFKVYDPQSNRYFTANGVGGQVNLNVELFKGFSAVTNNYWSNGGGRWIFGQAPDLIVRGDGSLSPVHSGSTVSGFEFARKSTLLYGYYGGIYIGRNVTTDPSNGNYTGYGYPGAPGGQNRTIQEATFGFSQALWKDPSFGALSLMGQYSHLLRNPWSVVVGDPKSAKQEILFLSLRYTLPGAPPPAK
jgi:hypothetical protein